MADQFFVKLVAFPRGTHIPEEVLNYQIQSSASISPERIYRMVPFCEKVVDSGAELTGEALNHDFLPHTHAYRIYVLNQLIAPDWKEEVSLCEFHTHDQPCFETVINYGERGTRNGAK